MKHTDWPQIINSNQYDVFCTVLPNQTSHIHPPRVKPQVMTCGSPFTKYRHLIGEFWSPFTNIIALIREFRSPFTKYHSLIHEFRSPFTNLIGQFRDLSSPFTTRDLAQVMKGHDPGHDLFSCLPRTDLNTKYRYPYIYV